MDGYWLPSSWESSLEQGKSLESKDHYTLLTKSVELGS